MKIRRILFMALLLSACGSSSRSLSPTRAASPVIKYTITGTDVTAISITLENDTGGTDQGDYKLPINATYRNFEPGDFVYISAQIIQPTSGAGSITCKIYQGTKVIAQAKASGFASIATCSGSVE